MSVKLVSMTQSTISVENHVLTPEELMVYTARVSAPQNQSKLETSAKLLKYLINNQHWSPLEMVDFTVEIETSRAIAQQILRHWSFSFQEFSQRYAVAQEVVLYPARRQDDKNRQNSIDDLPEDVKEWFSNAQMKVWGEAADLYNQALDKGIAKEQARFLLPLNTKTRMYMKGSIRDWLFYIKLRSSNGTQKEHADLAVEISDTVLKPHFPSVCEAVGW